MSTPHDRLKPDPSCSLCWERLRAEHAVTMSALADACEAIGWLLESYDPDEDPGPGIRADLAHWRDLLPPEARQAEIEQPTQLRATGGESRDD